MDKILRDHRIRQYRNGSDDQDHARPRNISRWGRWSASIPNSDGLARAPRLGMPATHEGIEGLRGCPMSATSALFSTRPRPARISGTTRFAKDGKKIIDLTPRRSGPT